MSFVSDVFGFVRFAYGLKAFLREQITVEAAKEVVRQGMQNRDMAFIEKVERAVFANPKSPYLKLFQNAGCELGDVKKLVSQDGLEGALRKLLEEGIFVKFKEFKGVETAVRGSQTFTFSDAEFDNPLITTHYRSSSGGSRGRPTRIKVDLAHISQSAPHWALLFATNNLIDCHLIFWTPTHPGMAIRHLMCAKFGKPFVKWFADVRMSTLKDRLLSTCVHGLVRWIAKWPKPEYVSLDEAWKVGEYLASLVQQSKKSCINTSPSEAVKISLVMTERGISLQNVTFILGAEPVTQARRKTIEGSGAKVVSTYGFSEGGAVGGQCSNPAFADDVHIFLDSYAVIQRESSLEREEQGGPLLLTALRAACPKVLLNTEIGDYAVLEKRRCECIFDELGYVQHLQTIRSSEKLTGLGMTVRGADLYNIIEEILPRLFGGATGHYQLIEEEDHQGLVRYQLLVSPLVGPLDEKVLIAVFLEEISKLRDHYRYMVGFWSRARIFRVERKNPLRTGRGKVLPFRTLERR